MRRSVVNAARWKIGERIPVRLQWDEFARNYLNHHYLGYAARVVIAGGVGGGLCFGLYRVLEVAQEGRPIAHRSVPRTMEVTFLERIQQEDTDMYIYRFALPNSYDCTGHDVVSSVEFLFPSNLPHMPCRRWLTPINHPDQRGIIEFGFKRHRPGELSTIFHHLKQGERVTIGRWLNEFHYEPNKYDNIGFICANSGVTPLLQMLMKSLEDPEDKTKFSLLYANPTLDTTPFRGKLLALQHRYPERFKVAFTVAAAKGAFPETASRATEYLRSQGPPPELIKGFHGKTHALAYDPSQPEIVAKVQQDGIESYVGTVNREMILETMPLPGEERSKVMVCGPAPMMTVLTGRTYPLLRFTYFSGFYGGILKELGYPKDQVYKFGSTVHLSGSNT